MSLLIEKIGETIRLNEDEKYSIESAFIPIKLSKGQCWIREGQYCNHSAFLQSGKLRVFYFDESGNEVTCYFVVAGNFISSLTSFLTRTTTIENIEAIYDCELLTITREDLEGLSETIPKLNVWRRILVENLFISMEKRIAMLQSQNAYKRYEQMIDEHPEIILNVPLQYTASFLGITPQHLSRLRKNIL